MGKRRINSEGTVYEYPEKSGIWYAQLPADDTGNRPKRRAASQKEALAKLREMQKAREKGMSLTKKRPTFSEFSRIWLDETVKRRVAESTFCSYEDELRLYVLPYVGSLRIDKITTPFLQKVVNDRADEGYGISTIKKVVQHLTSVLNLAIDYRYITFNPADAIRLPRIAPRQARALSLDELAILIPFLQKTALWLTFRIIIAFGLRRGEGVGATWRTVNWDAATIGIDQQVQAIRSKVAISPRTKTDNGIRTLPIPPLLLADLRAQWIWQQAERRRLGPGWKEHGLILCKSDGTPYAPTYVTSAFAECLQAAKLAPAVLHDLRHTAATLMGEQGTMGYVVRDILGHSPKSITDHYTHATLEGKREALIRLENAIFNQTAPLAAPVENTHTR